MAVKLNSYFIILFFILVTLSITGQSIVVTDYPDYKDREQHKRFLKKRKTVSEWQINKLKEGALIVKLRTNDLVIAALKKQGNDKLAEKKTLEQKIRSHNEKLTKTVAAIDETTQQLQKELILKISEQLNILTIKEQGVMIFIPY